MDGKAEHRRDEVKDGAFAEQTKSGLVTASCRKVLARRAGRNDYDRVRGNL